METPVSKVFKKHRMVTDPYLSSLGSPGPLPPIGKLPRAQLWRENGTKSSSTKDSQRIKQMEYHSRLEPEGYYDLSQRSCSCFTGCPQFQSSLINSLKNFDNFLNKNFTKLGQLVAEKPGYFIIIPLLLSFFFATGVQRIQYEDDPEYLFSPRYGPAKVERRAFEQTFPMNFSSFDPSRISSPGRFVRLIISAKDGGTIMRQNIWDEVVKVDQWMKNLTILYDEDLYRYEDLCAKWVGKCYENKILSLYDLLPEFLNGSLQLNYPVLLNPNNFQVYPLPLHFGGVAVDEENGIATSVKAMHVHYWLKSGTSKEDKRADIWEQSLVDSFNADRYKYTNIARMSSHTLGDELEVNTTSVIPYFGGTVTIMIIFCIVALLMSDWVRSKPIMGIIGIVSTVLACITAFGLLMYLGFPFIGINLAAPFLMLGIGMDDMFVMLAAWRRTRIQDSVSQRMGEAYREASVSITITSLTDMLSFFVGVSTPFPSVQIFCLYTGTAVFTTYVYQITLFGACMAIAGTYEAEQKHSVFCHVVKPKSEAKVENSRCYYIWCAGGISKNDPMNEMDNKPHVLMEGFRDMLGNFLNRSYAKVLILILFMLYLGGAIYGCLHLEEGLERRRLSRYDSYSVDFYNMEDKYFRDYPYRIQVMITGDVKYSEPVTRGQLLDLHNKLEHLPSIAGSLYTESWIRGWYEFLDTNAQYIDVNITEEANFIRELRDLYLDGDDNIYKLDVKFDANFSRILASRFVIQSFHIPNSNADKEMMSEVRRIAKESNFNVTVYHPLFVFFDQFALVRKVSIQAISFAAIMMMVVSLLFIPNPWCSLWVAFSIISIEIGVVGYMTLWGVNLDSISMINLIMCIGFSVDFSAHISYAYLTANVETTEDRVRECLYTLGLPIIQGAISTIIGVCALVFAPSYIFVTFFKTVFLVIFFGALHGILLLPVLLSILGPDYSKKPSSNSTTIVPGGGETGWNLKNSSFGLDKIKDDDAESIEIDLGLGTSGESSNDSSLSKATGAPVADNLIVKSRFQLHSALTPDVFFTNVDFINDEARERFSPKTKQGRNDKKLPESLGVAQQFAEQSKNKSRFSSAATELKSSKESSSKGSSVSSVTS